MNEGFFPCMGCGVPAACTVNRSCARLVDWRRRALAHAAEKRVLTCAFRLANDQFCTQPQHHQGEHRP